MTSTTRTRFTRTAALFVAAALALAACGDDGGSTASTSNADGADAVYGGGAPATGAAPTTVAPTTVAPTTVAPTTTAATATAAVTALKVASTSLGNVLVDGAGHTLYIFTKDEKNKSNCTAACLNAWPPLYGVPTAGAGVDASKLGSIPTADGKTQATIDGQPLYYFAADAAVGDVKGQNVSSVWFVVDGAGVVKK